MPHAETKHSHAATKDLHAAMKIRDPPGFPGGSVVKNLPANAGDAGDMDSIPGLGRSPAGGNGNPLQYSCLENPMDRGTWQPRVHRVTE